MDHTDPPQARGVNGNSPALILFSDNALVLYFYININK